MRARLLFLLKFLVYSLALFTVRHQLLHGYTWFLGHGMNIGNPGYYIPPKLEEFLYGSSVTIIAFFALILSTPSISNRKKVVVIAIGAIAFFLTDLLFVQFVLFPQRQPISDEDSPVFEIYLCIKWTLPFLLWIIPSYPYLGELINNCGKSQCK